MESRPRQAEPTRKLIAIVIGPVLKFAEERWILFCGLGGLACPVYHAILQNDETNALKASKKKLEVAILCLFTTSSFSLSLCLSLL